MKTIQFEKTHCPNCSVNVYRFIVETDDGPRIIDAPPGMTVSELENRL